MDVIWIFVMILELTKYVLLGNFYFKIKMKIERAWVAGIGIALFAVTLATGSIQNHYTTVIPVLIWIILMFLIDSNIKRKLTGILKIFLLTLYIDVIAGKFFVLFWNKSNVQESVQFLAADILILVLIGIFYCIRKKFVTMSRKNQNKVVTALIYACILGMAVTMLLTFAGLQYAGDELSNPHFSRQVDVLVFVGLLCILFLLYFLFYVSSMNRKMEKHLETEGLLLETQKSYYETMLQKEEDTRRFRHDIINHLICLREIMQQEPEQAVDYIENLQKNMTEIQQKCYSVGNTVIDAGLNYYISQLDEEVEIAVQGSCTGEIAVSQVELCTIFSNLIKNATEELRRQAEGGKYLKVLVNNGEKGLKIEVINSTAGKSKTEKNMLPETVKEDKRNHGIGLRNVKETVEKNKGVFQLDSTEEEFRVMIILPLEEKM